MLPQPYLLFLGDISEPAYAKTAFGLRDWAGERCIGEFACDGVQVSTGLPFLAPPQAREAGARAMVIGVANPCGRIPKAWLPSLLQALMAASPATPNDQPSSWRRLGPGWNVNRRSGIVSLL